MKKKPHEKGYTVPVKRRLSEGRYQKGWVKPPFVEEQTDEPITVCYDSGNTSTWLKKNIIHEPLGFNLRINRNKFHKHEDRGIQESV
jgi:hypothetical protein